jgi:hypothetical protein
LLDLVCSAALDVRDAQRLMADGWVDACGRFFRASGR